MILLLHDIIVLLYLLLGGFEVPLNLDILTVAMGMIYLDFVMIAMDIQIWIIDFATPIVGQAAIALNWILSMIS